MFVLKMFCFYLLILFIYSDAFPIFKRHDEFLSYFRQGECAFPKAVVIPEIEHASSDGNDALNNLFKSLDSCSQKTLSVEVHPICGEVYDVLTSLSTCNTKDFNDVQKPIDIKVQQDVCSGFKKAAATFLSSTEFVNYLRNRPLCETLCTGKYEAACKILLWAYEVQQQLQSMLKKSLFMNPFDEFSHGIKSDNCSFHDIVVAPKFPYIGEGNNLLEALGIPLKVCHHVAAHDKAHALCEAVFRALYSLTDCYAHLSGKERKSQVRKKIHLAVCDGFKKSNVLLSEDINDISPYLKDEDLCTIFCSPDVLSVCQTLLWAYEVKDSLYAEEKSATVQEGKVNDENNQSKAKAFPSMESQDVHPLKKDHLANPNSEILQYATTDVQSNLNGSSNSEVTESDGNENIVLHKEDKEKGFPDTSDHKKTRHSTTVASEDKKNKGVEGTTSMTSLDARIQSTDLLNVAKTMSQNITATSDVTKLYENAKHTTIIQNITGNFNQHPRKELTTSALSATASYETVAIPSTSTVSTISNTALRNFVDENEENENDLASLGKPATMNHIKSSKDITEFDGSNIYDSPFGMNDQKTFEPSYKQFDKSMQEEFIEQENSHFFLYFLCILALIAGCYLVVHNKQKVIALIVEGRIERRRRSHGAIYKKLDTK